MHLALLSQSIVTDGFKSLHWSSIGNAYLLCHVVNAVYRTIPYDIFYRDVVANEGLHIIVDIDDAHQSVSLLSEIIKK